jgi:prephenate dehydrogenase
VTGVDQPAVLAHALGGGAIDRGVPDLADLGEVDLVVLAAPVRQNIELLGRVAARVNGRALITDVGGTKRDIVQAAASLRGTYFIGGHPIGGAEQGGFGFARPDLFRGRPWIFTPRGGEPPETLAQLFSLVQGIGARPETLEVDAHDRLMAFLSHLPQLAASALMDVVGTAVPAEGLRLAGRGLVDTTRLASSPPGVWRDICAANADEIGAALDLLIARLTELRAGLQDGEVVDRIFGVAARRRAELMRGRD